MPEASGMVQGTVEVAIAVGEESRPREVIRERAKRAEQGDNHKRCQPPVALGAWPDPQDLGNR